MAETYRCILCDHQVTEETLSRGLPYCPGCGTTCAPCRSNLDVNVKVNWFELQVLVTWAENWAQQQKGDDGEVLKAVHAIAHRVSAQYPSLPPLTLAKAVSQMRDIVYIAKTPAANPTLHSAGIEQLLSALRDHLPQINSSADLSRFLSEVTKILNEVETQIRSTALRDE